MFSIVPYRLAATSRGQSARECQQHLDPQSLCAQELLITMLIDYGRNPATLWRDLPARDEPCMDERRMEGQLLEGGTSFFQPALMALEFPAPEKSLA
ncbi:hypothetical protein EOD23_20940 [Mesorhizobium sp. USDA-HM6]|nr:hypothetical protein EOD23_20940 [Mesorhizobium sp. USDA-HM6]